MTIQTTSNKNAVHIHINDKAHWVPTLEWADWITECMKEAYKAGLDQEEFTYKYKDEWRMF